MIDLFHFLTGRSLKRDYRKLLVAPVNMRDRFLSKIRREIDHARAILLLALPREIARHPTSGEPILAGIGRYGPYVQHGRTYANLGPDDDVLEIGGNRAIDLVVAKEQGGAGARFGRAAPTGRLLGDHPDGGPVTVRPGRYGAYVNWGKVNATLPKTLAADDVTLPDALRLIADKADTAPSGKAKPSRGSAKAATQRNTSVPFEGGTTAKPRALAKAGPARSPAKNPASKKRKSA